MDEVSYLKLKLVSMEEDHNHTDRDDKQHKAEVLSDLSIMLSLHLSVTIQHSIALSLFQSLYWFIDYILLLISFSIFSSATHFIYLSITFFFLSLSVSIHLWLYPSIILTYLSISTFWVCQFISLCHSHFILLSFYQLIGLYVSCFIALSGCPSITLSVYQFILALLYRSVS